MFFKLIYKFNFDNLRNVEQNVLQMNKFFFDHNVIIDEIVIQFIYHQIIYFFVLDKSIYIYLNNNKNNLIKFFLLKNGFLYINEEHLSKLNGFQVLSYKFFSMPHEHNFLNLVYNLNQINGQNDIEDLRKFLLSLKQINNNKSFVEQIIKDYDNKLCQRKNIKLIIFICNYDLINFLFLIINKDGKIYTCKDCLKIVFYDVEYLFKIIYY